MKPELLPYSAQAFGFGWKADVPLTHFDAAPQAHAAKPTVAVQQVIALPPRLTLGRRDRGSIFADGFRFRWNDCATFDFYAPGKIDYLPGPDWQGDLPDSFFSTVAALVAAWNGLLPMHATALELGGRAVLFAGPAGAGKSTLAAELLECGARLVGDDLTVLAPGQSVQRGRPAMRLHPDSADRVELLSSTTVPEDPRGKLLVRPARRATVLDLPLAGIVLLGGRSGPISPVQALRLLPAHLFRPRWNAVLPGHFRRRAWLLELASTVPVLGLPPVTGFDPAARAARAESTLAALVQFAR